MFKCTTYPALHRPHTDTHSSKPQSRFSRNRTRQYHFLCSSHVVTKNQHVSARSRAASLSFRQLACMHAASCRRPVVKD